MTGLQKKYFDSSRFMYVVVWVALSFFQCSSTSQNGTSFFAKLSSNTGVVVGSSFWLDHSYHDQVRNFYVVPSDKTVLWFYDPRFL